MTSPSPSPQLWHRSVEILFIFLIFFIAGGDPAPGINEAQYLSKAKHFWTPGWCPDDHFLTSADAHYVFYWTIGLLTKWCSLDVTAWIGRCAGWLFLAVSWQRLNWRIYPKFGAAILSAAIWQTLTFRCHMSGEWVVGGIEAKVIAYGFVLLAISAIADGRWIWVWPWLGIASSFHVLVGGWSVLAAMMAWLLSRRNERIPLLQTLPFLIIGGTLSLPGLLPVLLLSRGLDSGVVAEGARIYVFERLQHHLVLRSFAPPFLLRFTAMTIVWLIASNVFLTGNEYRRIFRFVLGSIFIAFVGAMVDFGIQDHTLAAQWLRFYWFRLSDVAVPLGVSLLALEVLRSGLAISIRASPSASLPDNYPNRELRHGRNFKPQIVFASILVGLCVVSLSDIALNPNSRWISGADRQGPIRSIDHRNRWNEVCQWIVGNIEDDRPILAPTNHLTFKWNTGHSEVVNWKDVPQDPQGICEWFERLNEVRSFFNSANVTPENEKEATIRQLAMKFNFRYFLVERRYGSLRNLPFARLFENQSYVIYDLGKSERS